VLPDPPLGDGTPPPPLPNSTDYFWLLGGLNNRDVNQEREGFGTPAFANLQRVNFPTDPRVHVGITPNNTDAEVILNQILPPVTVGNTTTTTSIWRVNVQTSPYITAISYAGDIRLSESISLPFSAFYVDFEVVTVATGGGNTGNFFHTDPDPNPDPANPADSAWSHVQMGYPSITVNDDTPPASVPMPDMLGDCDTHGIGFTNFRNGIRDNARSPEGGYTIFSAQGGTNMVIHGISPGVISINGGLPQNVSNIRVNGQPNSLVLTGDFTGVNFYAPNAGVTLGSETIPFEARNVAGNETYIAASGNVTVNMVNNIFMENISVASTNGAMLFRSPGEDSPSNPRAVHLGAIFVANNINDSNNEIRATSWGIPTPLNPNPMPIPQFMSHQAVNMEFTAVGDSFDMGALIMSASGDAITTTVNNPEARFHGMFVGQNNAGINTLGGSTDLVYPPNPPSMPMLERFRNWQDGGGGGGGGTTTTTNVGDILSGSPVIDSTLGSVSLVR
jgi:hypothetical protein